VKFDVWSLDPFVVLFVVTSPGFYTTKNCKCRGQRGGLFPAFSSAVSAAVISVFVKERGRARVSG
jgi:hypothetical protein